ncbi:hypothetical protein EC988_010071, partial [Linderina pennispora]
NEDGDTISEPFEELPDKDEYPDYYEVIWYPMALTIISGRIASKEGYRSFDAFNYDMMWIFNNATFFNESGSQIYQDTVDLESEYFRVRREVLDRYKIPFDTSHSDQDPEDGRYVSRITAGELDLHVGDFIYIKNNNTMKVAMISHLRVGGPQDRRKYIDGYWFMTPSEIPEMVGQNVYPHELFAGPKFEGHGVRGVVGKCYILPFVVYPRAYPKGYSPQDVFV